MSPSPDLQVLGPILALSASQLLCEGSCICARSLESCPTLCDPTDCSPPGSAVRRISQARILEWVAISFSRGSSQPRDQTQVSHIAGGFFTVWATREAQRRVGVHLNSESSSWRDSCLYVHPFNTGLQIPREQTPCLNWTPQGAQSDP